jgi:hypothetical protein
VIDTRLEAAEERFRTLLLRWLAKLPPDGWEGTSHELGEELDGFAERHRLFAFVPLCPGRKVAGMVTFFAAHGFALTHRRTKHARTLRFTRSPGDA